MEQLCCPCDFSALSVEKQKEIFETAKTLANYKEVEKTFKGFFWDHETQKYIRLKDGETYTSSIPYIFRPIRIKELPKGWEFYTKYINEAYPEGESLILNKGITLENYKILYSWIHGGCTRCHAKKERIYWDEGDKHITYYCSGCGDETPFVKHWRAYV